MNQLNSFFRFRRSVLYLIEPIFAFIAVVLLVVLFAPSQPEPSIRIIELHAQDILSVLQRTNSEEIVNWFYGNESLKIGHLVRAVNPSYGYTLEVTDGRTKKKMEHNRKRIGVSAERFIPPLRVKLTLWL